MSKINAIYKLAVEAGFPETVYVEYHRKKWYLSFPVPMGLDARAKNPTTLIAEFESVEQAESRLAELARDWLTEFERVLKILDGNIKVLSTKEADLLLRASKKNFEHPFNDVLKLLLDEGILDATKSFARDGWLNIHITPLGEKLVADFGNELEALLQPKAVSHAIIAYSDLLDVLENAIQTGQGVTLTSAQTQTLLEQLPPTKPSGQYTRLPSPSGKRSPIEWKQPQSRESPVWEYSLTCPYCSDTVTIERRSPKEPAHCGKEGCQKEHERILARERKRRQRLREKAE